jgi:hypothetical protein
LKHKGESASREGAAWYNQRCSRRGNGFKQHGLGGIRSAMRDLIRATRLAWFVAVALLVAWDRLAVGQNVQLSLNVFPASNANPSGGGTWALYAKSDAANGIAAIESFITGIDVAGISYGPGINASLDNGSPHVIPGSPVELLYFQDTSMPGVVIGVGTPMFSSGLDPLGNPAWDNATKIATGTYSATAPFFASSGSYQTDANVLSTNTPPFGNSLDANTDFIVRMAISGDYNVDGVVDLADYIVWRDNLGSGTSLRNDDTAGVGPDDYARWRSNFGPTVGSGADVGVPSPEPATILLLMLAASGRSIAVRPKRTGAL